MNKPRRIYLAGPISIDPLNYKENFKNGVAKLQSTFPYGTEIFNPADNEEGPNLSYRDCMRIDLNYILDKATTIALLPGWEHSPGAQAEWALAKCLKLEIIYV